MKTPEMVLLEKPEQVDLLRHGVVEAHAGTGKTYTIVKVLLRLLSGDHGRMSPLPLREILLVTYTDKAAGELRQRIRKGLVEAIADPKTTESLKPILQDSLNTLHEAWIGTIHSICLRILRQWPFETGVQFQLQNVSDQDGIESLRTAMVRQVWNAPDSLFPWTIQLLESTGNGVNDKLWKKIVDVAGKLLDTEHTQLQMEAFAAHDLASLQKLSTQISIKNANLAQQLKPWLNKFVELGLQMAHHELTPEVRRQKLLEKIAILQESFQSLGFLDECWKNPLKSSNMVFYEKNKAFHKAEARLCLKFEEAGNQLQKFCKEFREQYEDFVTSIQPVLIAESAMTLSQMWQQQKDAQGLISFQDMLRLVHRAVHQNPALLSQLQDRITFGIIDEFQDTSVLQWDIFQKIFLHGNRQRLLVVGDPKQSIYSFQGADVSSYVAAKDAICSQGGVLYGLVYNYRSLPSVIAGYNSVCGRTHEADANWFAHADIDYPAPGPGGVLAKPGLRKESVALPEGHAVRVVEMFGSPNKNLPSYVNSIVRIIRSYLGKEIWMPEGNEWKKHVVGLQDFAIIAEFHKVSDRVLELLSEKGILAVKYKQVGVFQSSMSRHVRTLLLAIHDPRLQAHIHALLTYFFQKSPYTIQIESDLAPNSVSSQILVELRGLARYRRWGQFIETLLERTQIESTLARLTEGERHLADLHQILEYVISTLIRENGTLKDMVDRLENLWTGAEDVGQDQNLHVLATEKQAIHVLTMHASKGLEYPFVFLMTSPDKSGKKGEVHQWTDQGKLLIQPGGDCPPVSKSQREQERRRLLYVAATRPKVMLVLPAHKEKTPKEHTLTPRLEQLLERQELSRYHPQDFPPSHVESESVPRESLDAEWMPTNSMDLPWENLQLPTKRSVQTSYTELSHGFEHDREQKPAAEQERVHEEFAPSVLPRGSHTGDALHKMLESCIGDSAWKEWDLQDRLRKQAEMVAVLAPLSMEAQEKAVAAAERMVRFGMNATYDLGEWGRVVLADLHGHCRAELEFQMPEGPDWLHGFMDVVYRLPNSNNAHHPYRYFVLDWKTNSLPRYALPEITQSIVQEHYDLQAKVYSFALHRFLQGLLGEHYSPTDHLGAAVYVYLRGFETAESVPVWLHVMNPVTDGEFVQKIVKDFLRSSPWK